MSNMKKRVLIATLKWAKECLSMRSNESHKKYNIEKECLLMRSNESHKKYNVQKSSYQYAQMSRF